jgi:hypothetical protein
VTLRAHFDGKVIVPDEPLDLPLNQTLIVQIERLGDEPAVSGESALAWLVAHAVDGLPADLADRHDYYLYGRRSAGNQGDSTGERP